MSAILDEDAGYDVTLFNGETTAIDEIAASEPELIIVDLLLGGASGWDIVALSRADERLADVPIIICSADVVALRDRRPSWSTSATSTCWPSRSGSTR